jgi:hypothetical protein
LVRAGTYAPTVTGIRGRAALGLALVILEHEKAVGAGFKRRAIQGLIGGITLPLAYSIRTGQCHAIKSTHLSIIFLGATGILQVIGGKTLASWASHGPTPRKQPCGNNE